MGSNVPSDPNGNWKTQQAIWFTLLVTLTGSLYVVHLSGFRSWAPSPCTSLSILLAHAFVAHLAHRNGGAIFETRMPRRPLLDLVLSFILLLVAVFLCYLLQYGWDPYGSDSALWSVVFLGLLSSYLFCICRVVSPGVHMWLPIAPLFRAVSITPPVAAGWALCFVVSLPVLVVMVYFDCSDHQLIRAAEEAADSGLVGAHIGSEKRSAHLSKDVKDEEAAMIP